MNIITTPKPDKSSVGNAFLRSQDLVTITRRYLRQLMEESGETANLAVRDNLEMVYLARAECRQMMRALAKPRGRVPIAGSAAGKTLLARMPEDDVGRVLGALGLNTRTRKAIDALPRMLKELRGRFYPIDNKEHAIALRCVAAAVFDHLGEPLGAISVSGPTARVTNDRIAPLGVMVRNVAREVSTALGGVWLD
jgi:IclR family acetate operon transcriptional repressor